MISGCRSRVSTATLLPLGLLLSLLVSEPVAALHVADQSENVAKGRPLQLLRGNSRQQKVQAADITRADIHADASEASGTLGDASDDEDVDDAPEQDDVLEVEAAGTEGPLHMVLHNLPYGVDNQAEIKVDTVDKGFWADKAGIEPGSVIVTVNGLTAKSMTEKDFISTLRTRPLRLTIRMPSEEEKRSEPPVVPAPVVSSPSNAPVKAPPSASAQAALDAAREAKMKDDMMKELQKILGVGGKQGTLKQQIKKIAQGTAEKVVKQVMPTVSMTPAPAPPLAAGWQPLPLPAPPAGIAGPPLPVPPSPLDALKAAMAIRANLTSGSAPLLPMDVLDRVAEMARNKLGNFVPKGPGGPPCDTVVGGFAPAPAPAVFNAAPAKAPAAPRGPVTEKVVVMVIIKNVSFTALNANPSMMAQFEQIVKQSVAEAAAPGVKPEDIVVTLSAGSVVIKAVITPPPGVEAADLAKKITAGLANLGARMVARLKEIPGATTILLGTMSVGDTSVKVEQVALPTTTVTTTAAPVRKLPKPPKCAAAPPKVSKSDVRMALAPFRPPGARGKGVKTQDGGTAWPLEDGGWAFQYPDMALRMAEDGSTRIVWSKPAYAVEYDESGISYHVGQNVVHRDTNGDLTYQQPTGTMHQEGSTLVYHWCSPNVIVYQTPAGFVYYDDMGMTYRSFGKDVTHYTWSGEVLYQGAGGVTRQGADGTVTHWTDAGAVFRHPDGSVTYTAVGESSSQALSISDLGPDPFPGADLTTGDVMRLSKPAPPGERAPGAPTPEPWKPMFGSSL